MNFRLKKSKHPVKRMMNSCLQAKFDNGSGIIYYKDLCKAIEDAGHPLGGKFFSRRRLLKPLKNPLKPLECRRSLTLRVACVKVPTISMAWARMKNC